MPVKELVASMDCEIPANVAEVSGNLGYRDFLTVGMLAKKLVVKDSDRSRRHDQRQLDLYPGPGRDRGPAPDFQ